jgi:hypothetical protein
MDAYFPQASLGSLSQINLICASWVMAAERSQSTHNGGYTRGLPGQADHTAQCAWDEYVAVSAPPFPRAVLQFGQGLDLGPLAAGCRAPSLARAIANAHAFSSLQIGCAVQVLGGALLALDRTPRLSALALAGHAY